MNCSRLFESYYWGIQVVFQSHLQAKPSGAGSAGKRKSHGADKVKTSPKTGLYSGSAMRSVVYQSHLPAKPSGAGSAGKRKSHGADKVKTSPKTGFYSGSAMRSDVAERKGFALAEARVHGGCGAPPAPRQEPPFRIPLLENSNKKATA